mmetsp:Transcript_62567/g.179967  ORF Transcript_62567/g.179967 Transcript_62567/m.179967 type:complete len:96 (+) Transcript_62567:1845-2132(+)
MQTIGAEAVATFLRGGPTAKASDALRRSAGDDVAATQNRAAAEGDRLPAASGSGRFGLRADHLGGGRKATPAADRGAVARLIRATGDLHCKTRWR